MTVKLAHAANQPPGQRVTRVARGPGSGFGVRVDPPGQADQLSAHGANMADIAVRDLAQLLDCP
jgi:hypothetical protein